jgi:RimJ/RimL family protein N-acetyltransferase
MSLTHQVAVEVDEKELLPVQTDRLTIRRMSERDVDDYLEYVTHPDLLHFSNRAPYSKDEALGILERRRIVPLGSEREWVSLGVDCGEDGKLIGEVCLKVLSWINRQGEVGWFFNPAYQRRGFATEAGRALMDLGFRGLDLHRLSGRCYCENERSRLLMERLGMRREGLQREVACIKGPGFQSTRTPFSGRSGKPMGNETAAPKRRLYAQIWQDIGRLNELQDGADRGEAESLAAFQRTYAAIDVKRIFLDSLEAGKGSKG